MPSVEQSGLATSLHRDDFCACIRTLITTQARIRDEYLAPDIFTRQLDLLVDTYCYRSGIAALPVRAIGEDDWVQAGVRLASASWQLKIDADRLLMLPGSAICRRIAEQLRIAEINAILIGQQADIARAVGDNALMTDDQWQRASAALAQVCGYPLNRYLLQEVARQSRLALLTTPLWPHFESGDGSASRNGARFATLASSCQDPVNMLGFCVECAYICPVRDHLFENYRILSVALASAGPGRQTQGEPDQTQRLDLMDATPSLPESSSADPSRASVFFRTGAHFEQLELITFLAEIGASDGLEIIANHLSRSMARQHCRLEIQRRNNAESTIWLTRVRNLPLAPLTQRQWTLLLAEIRQDVAALLAYREHSLRELQHGCAAMNGAAVAL